MNNFVIGYAHSGTRVIQLILDNAGIHVGDKANLNETYDDHWTLQDFAEGGRNGKMDEGKFKEHFEKFRQGHKDWSLKNCEAMIPPNLDFLDKSFPDFTCVLIMRNPLDNVLIDLPWAEEYPNLIKDFIGNFWEKRMRFYNLLHEYAFDFFQDKQKRLLVVKLEELVVNPEREIKRLFDFLKIKKDPDDFTHLIQTPVSIGKRNRQYVFNHVDYGEHIYDPQKDKHRLRKLAARWL